MVLEVVGGVIIINTKEQTRIDGTRGKNQRLLNNSGLRDIFMIS